MYKLMFVKYPCKRALNMKNLICILILLFTFSSQVNASEIIMNCQGTLYKYKKTFISTSIEIRVDAKWYPYCNESDRTLITTDMGAKCEIAGGLIINGWTTAAGKEIIDFLKNDISYFDKDGLPASNDCFGCVDKVNCRRL